MSKACATVLLFLAFSSALAFNLASALAQAAWDDVLPQVKQRCAAKWQDDYSMQAYCIKKQREGWEAVNADNPPAPRFTGEARNAAPLPISDTQSEAGLTAIVAKYVRLYNSGPNNMVKGGLRPERGRDICSLMTRPYIRNWHGTVHSLSSNNDGNGVLEVDLGGDVFVRTMNNDFSDSEYHTLIPHGAPLFADAATLHIGQSIEFSGVLFRDPVDCFKEISLTVDGAMQKPEFLIRFSAVKHQDDVSTTSRDDDSAHAPIRVLSAPDNPQVATDAPAAGELPAFIDGRDARIGFERWFSTITDDERRAGASFWASNRSAKSPPENCHYSSPEFENGCLEAKRLLTPADIRRRTEPEFKRGWNSL